MTRGTFGSRCEDEDTHRDSRHVGACDYGSVVLTGPRQAENDAAVIKRLSQAFSDASASGNALVLKRLLDDNVIFINENGDQATKKDLVDSASPPPKGVFEQARAERSANQDSRRRRPSPAFTDNATVNFYGQSLHAAYRSTEVWVKEHDGWKMVSSQTLALQQDPPAVTLPSSVLDQYVGTYSGGDGLTVVIAHVGDGLTAAANGGKPAEYKAELKDVFFVAGQPRNRRIFQRDATGAVTGYVNRREGRDIVYKRTA